MRFLRDVCLSSPKTLESVGRLSDWLWYNSGMLNFLNLEGEGEKKVEEVKEDEDAREGDIDY